MTKLIEAIVALRDRFAKRIEAASPSLTQDDEKDLAANLAKFDAAIEGVKEFVERMEKLIGHDDSLWGAQIQFRGMDLEEVVERANQGDPYAHFFACTEAFLAIDRQEPLPRPLELYTAKILVEAASSRGKGRPTDWARNTAIIFLLNLLKGIDIPPTRNCATDPEQECGSSLVAEWLNNAGDPISEAGVARVWEKYRGQVFAYRDLLK